MFMGFEDTIENQFNVGVKVNFFNANNASVMMFRMQLHEKVLELHK